MIKSLLRKYLPSIFNYLKRYSELRRLKDGYIYDITRYFNYSDYYYNDSEQRCMMRIIHRYHPIEKGLTMPEMRLGFGKENIVKLIKDCLKYKDQYLMVEISKKSAGYQQYCHAISTLMEYKKVHDDHGYAIDVEILHGLDNLKSDSDIHEITGQIEITKEQYLEHINSSFGSFAFSRHSLRNFKGKIRLENVIKAIEIAQKTPSACNRQPGRVHIVEDEGLKKSILKIQGGNRGFGHLADKVLIVTAELVGYRDITERNNVFVDGGLFSMSLLYALHSYGIGTCPLNWCSSVESDVELRQIVKFPESQTVIMMIACGGIPDKFKLAFSKRSSLETVYSLH